jgi:hypothetical protein
MLCFASIYSSMYPEVRGFVGIHIVSKITSVLGFSYLFMQKRYFAYLLGAVTDFTVIVTVLGFYLRSVTAVPPAQTLASPEDRDAQEPSVISNVSEHHDTSHAER